jgi:IS1 family transposase
MQTIDEYKAYTKQLEEEVGTWHKAYDALMVERNQLVSRIKELERQLKKEG